MALITVSIDATRPLALLKNGSKRMAYAVANAMNATAKEIQKAERARVRQEFTVRKEDFLMRQAAVIRGEQGGSGFASVGKARFEVRIAVGQKDRLFLSGFEAGDERRPRKGKNVAVPVTGGPARPTFGTSVESTAFTFGRLGLRRAGSRGRKRSGAASLPVGGKPQWKGANRTFQIGQTAKMPKGGIFQRIGPGRDDIRVVYSFQPPKRLERRLRFIQTGRQVAATFWPIALKREVDSALAYNFLGVKL